MNKFNFTAREIDIFTDGSCSGNPGPGGWAGVIIHDLISILTGQEEPNPIFILVVVGQILIIRYAFIGLAFKFLSRQSLNRLRDVLDVEWIKN